MRKSKVSAVSFRAVLAAVALPLAQLASAVTYTPQDYVVSDAEKYFLMPFNAYGEMTTEARVWIPEIPAGNTQYVLAGGGSLWNISVGSGNLAYYRVSSLYGNWGWSDYEVASGTWVDLKTENFSTGYYLYVKSPSDADYGEPVYTKLYSMSPVAEADGVAMAVLGSKDGNNVLRKMPAGTKLAWIKFWRKTGGSGLEQVADLRPYVDEDGFEYLKDELSGVYTLASDSSKLRYFVNCDSGLDSNSGLTPAEAFKTLEYALNTKAAAAKVPCLVRIGGDSYPAVYTPTASLSISQNNLTVKGETGRAVDVVIDAGRQNFTPVSFNNVTDSRIESLTIRNGYRSNEVAALKLNGTRPVASNIVVTCCEASATGAHIGIVSLVGTDPVLQDSAVVANTNSNNGGVVMLYRSGRVERCVIASNVNASNGGGVTGYHGSGSFYGSNGMLVESCVITNNAAAGGGGTYDVPKVVNSRIENNRCTQSGSSGYGGGGVLLQTAKIGSAYFDLLVTNCVIASNAATDGGGGIVFYNASVSNLLVDACVITNNTVAPGYRNRGGAGVQLWTNPTVAGGNVTIRNSLVAANRFTETQANSQGSGILANASTGKIRIENCTVTGNRNFGSYKSAINAIGTVELVNVAAVDNYDTAGNPIHGITSMVNGAGKTDTGDWASSIQNSLLYPAETVWTFDAVQNIKNGLAPRFGKVMYVPSASSPLRDAGASLPWHADASDLQRAVPEAGQVIGAPFRRRVVDVVDIGCYEYDRVSGLLLIMR